MLRRIPIRVGLAGAVVFGITVEENYADEQDEIDTVTARA